MGLKAFEAMQKHLRGASNTDWLLLMAGVAALLLFFVLLKVLVTEVRRHRSTQAGWQEFAGRIGRLGLNAEQSQLLSQLARAHSPASPLDVMRKPEAFEEAVHRHLKLLVAGAGDAALAGRRVTALRAKLNFRIPPDAFYSTRLLKPKQQVHLKVRDRAAPFDSWAEVTGRREDYLELVGVKGVRDGLLRHKTDVLFFSGKSAFSFETQVAGLDAEKGTCLLLHSVNVRTGGLRQVHRVEVNRPVTFRAVWEAEDVRREGMLLDLSAGGLSLICPCYYEAGEQLTLFLQPTDYLGPLKGEEIESLGERQLKGAILRSRRTADRRCRYHVEFRDVAAADRQYLFRLVQRLELLVRKKAGE